MSGGPALGRGAGKRPMSPSDDTVSDTVSDTDELQFNSAVHILPEPWNENVCACIFRHGGPLPRIDVSATHSFTLQPMVVIRFVLLFLWRSLSEWTNDNWHFGFTSHERGAFIRSGFFQRSLPLVSLLGDGTQRSMVDDAVGSLWDTAIQTLKTLGVAIDCIDFVHRIIQQKLVLFRAQVYESFYNCRHPFKYVFHGTTREIALSFREPHVYPEIGPTAAFGVGFYMASLMTAVAYAIAAQKNAGSFDIVFIDGVACLRVTVLMFIALSGSPEFGSKKQKNFRDAGSDSFENKFYRSYVVTQASDAQTLVGIMTLVVSLKTVIANALNGDTRMEDLILKAARNFPLYDEMQAPMVQAYHENKKAEAQKREEERKAQAEARKVAQELEKERQREAENIRQQLPARRRLRNGQAQVEGQAGAAVTQAASAATEAGFAAQPAAVLVPAAAPAAAGAVGSAGHLGFGLGTQEDPVTLDSDANPAQAGAGSSGGM